MMSEFWRIQLHVHDEHEFVKPESLDDETDGGLLRRFAEARDERAFARLVERRGALVVGVCARMMQNHADAEDAYQAVFLVLARRGHALRRCASLAGWLHNVAVRVCLNERRGRRRRERQLQEAGKLAQEQESARPEPLVELKHVIDEELAALPARLREVLILCDLEGHTQAEVARALSLPVGTVSSRLMRGREAMRKRLLRQGFSYTGGGVAAALATCSQAAPPITAELVQATIHNAHIFMFGTAAAKAALSTKITTLAEGVVHTMILSRWKVAVALFLFVGATLFSGTMAPTVVPGLIGTASAATIFFDDFEDGSVTDGIPVKWEAAFVAPTTIFNVVQGDLRVSASQPNTLGAVGPFMILGNISIRAQVRLEGQSNEGVAVFVRGTGNIAHTFQVAADSGLYFGIADSPLQRIQSDLRPTQEDVIIQLDAIGNSITAWAWRPGEPKPTAPAFSVITNQLPSGYAGVLYAPADLPLPTAGTAIYRYVHVADMSIPEPRGAALAAAGGGLLAGGLFFSRRRL